MASRKSSRRCWARKNRKNSRKTSRKETRRNRKSSRKNRKSSRRNRRQRGGAYNPMALSLLQGMEYGELHRNQHGGGGYQAGGYAPVGDQGLLPADLRTMARVSPLDGALDQIKGMSDLPQATEVPKQSGGGYNMPPPPPKTRKGRKNRKTNRRRRNTAARRNNLRRSNRRRRGGQRGGGAHLSGAPVSAPGMLLTPAEAARAGTADFSDPLLRGR
jgi:hypothetical protein